MTVRQAIEQAHAALAAGKLDDARSLAKAVQATLPGNISAQGIIAATYYEQGRYEEAAAAFRQALALMRAKPSPSLEDLAQYEHNLATALENTGDRVNAEKHYRQALLEQPDRPQTVAQLTAMLRNLGRADEALALNERAVQLFPNDPGLLYSLASTLSQLGNIEQAMRLHQSAIALKPDMHEAHSNLGICHLLRGEFDPGWDLFEWRWQSPQLKTSWANFPAPLWNGDDLGQRILMVWAEQGLGDCIQFIRYLAILRQRYPDAGLVFWGPRTLFRLFERFAKRNQVTMMPREMAPNPAHIRGMDCHVPLMSLPRIMGTRLDTIPAFVPNYLELEPEWVELWRERIRQLDYSGHSVNAIRPLNVGLVWSGSPHLMAASKRNLKLAMLEPWLDIAHVRWFSLQIGEEARAEIAGSRWQHQLVDWTADIKDFADTASLAAALDVVISVDTSTAHAASAIGVPVWMLSRFDGCWRWLQEREDSPWYPKMRIFRQSKHGDWSDVITSVEEALHARVAELGASTSFS